jgi:hypothetical protein
VELTPERVEALNVALNEATLVGVEIDAEQRLAAITLSVLALPPDGPAPRDSRVQLVLAPIGRVAASLRHGRWDDAEAPVEPFELDELRAVVERAGGCAIYGSEFFDVPEEKDFARWSDRLSLDWRAGEADGSAHTLALFQEAGKPGHLDLCLWFDELSVFRPDSDEIPLDEFAAAGKRWWDALYANDPRTQGSGIVPFSGDGAGALQSTLDEVDS